MYLLVIAIGAAMGAALPYALLYFGLAIEFTR